MASGVEGMLAPSATSDDAVGLTSVLASLPVSSFWVAHGSATSQGTSQIEPVGDEPRGRAASA
jgi:hypothetical protein